MGATSWWYHIPYRPDIIGALHAHQQQLFATYQYSPPESDPGTPDPATLTK